MSQKLKFFLLVFGVLNFQDSFVTVDDYTDDHYWFLGHKV